MTLLAVLASLAIALFIGYLSLRSGPVSLPFLVAPIERVLNDELQGIKAKIERAILQVNPAGALELRLEDVEFLDTAGRFRTEASHATFELSFSALVVGRIAPSRIDLLKPRVQLTPGPDRQKMAFGRALQGQTITMPAAFEGAREVQIPKSGTADAPRTVTVIRRRFEIARALADVARQVRRRKGTASYLTTLAMRDAAFTLDEAGRTSTIEIPELTLAFNRTDPTAIIQGSAVIGSEAAPVRVRFDASDRNGPALLDVRFGVERMVPRTLAHNQPALGLLEALGMPVTATLALQLTRHGELISGEIEGELEAGEAFLPWLAKVPLKVGGGRLRASYIEETQSFRLDEITVRSGTTWIKVAGTIEPVTSADGSSGWRVALENREGIIGADAPGGRALPIEALTLRGSIFPESRHADVREFRLKVAGAEVLLNGEISAEESTRAGRLNGELGPMPIALIHRLWPQALAPQTRDWIARHGVAGNLVKGSFTVISSGSATGAGPAPSRRIAMRAEFEGLELAIEPSRPRLRASRALLEVDGSDARLTMPHAEFGARPGELQLRQAALSVSDIDSHKPKGRIETRLNGQLAGLSEAMRLGPLTQLASHGIDPASLDGRIEGTILAEIPVGPHASLSDLRILDGTKVRLTEGHARLAGNRQSISGASLTIETRGEHLEGSGEMLLAGIHTRLSWRQGMGSGPVRAQIRTRAVLGNSERAQLGIELAPLLTGDLTLDLTLATEPGETPRIQIAVDLTKAELQLRDIAWSKPAGERAEARFDVTRRPDGQFVLQNLKISSERNSIAAAGWIALGPDMKPVEYLFQQLRLNTASTLQLEGRRHGDDSWIVKARGTFFDASSIIEQWLAPAGDKVSDWKGSIALTAMIDTVVGKPYDANHGSDRPNYLRPQLAGVSISMRKSQGVLTQFSFSGEHSGGSKLTANLTDPSASPKRLDIDIADAGEALKFIGLYTRMRGGHGRLTVNLHTEGPSDRSGALVIHKFHLIGDRTVGEIVHSNDPGQPLIGQAAMSTQRAPPERIQFDRLDARFQSGHGQLVIEHAGVTGPLFGASIRGKLDFRSRRMALGGTYVPLTDLNRAFSDVPILGELLTGPRREGVIGMTFQIDGDFSSPRVTPIPFSMATPGILREIFQITPENLSPPADRTRRRPARSPEPRTTASPPVTGPSSGAGGTAKARTSSEPPAANAPVLEGWGARAAPPRAEGVIPPRP